MSSSLELPSQSPVPERVVKAIALSLEGKTWRQIGAELDYDHSSLWKLCAPYLTMLKQEDAYNALKRSVMALATEATSQTMDALIEGRISDASLPILMGIAHDKVAKHMSERAPVDVGGMVASVLDRLQAGGGGSVKLEITSGPAAPQAVTLDVTPEK